MRLVHLLLFTSFLAISFCSTHYYIGDQGLSCNQVCFKQNKNCNPRIVTDDNFNLFTQLGINCQASTVAWNSQEQPSYISDPKNKNFGKCMGYVGVPAAGHCHASDPSSQRLCRCDDPEDGSSTFGTGYADGDITKNEKWVFQHFVKPGDVGVITHFWTTYRAQYEEGTIIRYYIDGEKTASIQFTPSLACGVGFYDNNGPWGIDWFGKGAKDSAWYNNFKIPFQKSIVVTIQHTIKPHADFFMIIRGSVNVPIVLGGVTLPKTAKMNQNIISSSYKALEFVPMVNVPSGAGAHFMITMAVQSKTMDFLEGCVHAYFDGNTEFPGVLLSTGTEDYFESAFYFNGGQYKLPDAGFTHQDKSGGNFRWSAYRFHDKDNLFFKNGFRMDWRVGDIDDVTGMKCHTLTGGKVHKNPQSVTLNAYAWYYTWDQKEECNKCG